MIHGLLDEQMLQPLEPPAPSLVFDFVNASYLVNGASVAVGDVIDSPELVDGGGLNVGFTDPDYQSIAILGDALAILLAYSKTMVIEFELINGSATAVFVAQGGGVFNENTIYVVSLNDANPTYIWDYVDGQGGRREALDNGAVGTGIHRIAVTRTNNKIAFAIDGGSVVSTSDTRTPLDSPTSAQFGGYVGNYAWNDCRIRYFAAYDTLANSMLPGLSAL